MAAKGPSNNPALPSSRRSRSRSRLAIMLSAPPAAYLKNGGTLEAISTAPCVTRCAKSCRFAAMNASDSVASDTSPACSIELPMTRTLTLRALRFFGLTYAVLEEGRPVAELKLGWGRKRGMLDVEGDRYSFYRTTGRKRVLERDAVILATAMKKPSWWKNIFILKYEGQEYCLSDEESWPTIVIRSAEQQVGSAGLSGPSTFPAAWPLHLSVFLIWHAHVLCSEEVLDNGA